MRPIPFNLSSVVVVGDKHYIESDEALSYADLLYSQGKEERDSEICRKLQHWADMTREVNPDIAIGYDHSVSLIKRDFEVESDLIKSCENCDNQFIHETKTVKGCVPMCCVHCKYALDLRDKWKAREVYGRDQ